MSTELATRIKRSKQNEGLFLGTMMAMAVATIFYAFVVGVTSPGTYLAAALTGTFLGLMLASRQRSKTLEARLIH